MSQSIHPTALIDPSAHLGAHVEIGPFCIVGGDVELGDGVKLHNNVVVEGRTRIGAETQIFPFAVIGSGPQDKKWRGGDLRLEVGARNIIREHVTMHIGTETGDGVTTVGDDNFFMVNAHVAHDCHVGNHCIMANNSALGGHVVLQDFVILGGMVGVHQFVRVGAHAFCGVSSVVVEDVIPFGLVTGNRAVLSNLNLTGLKRRNFDAAELSALRGAFRDIFRAQKDDTVLLERVRKARTDYPDSACVAQLVDFMLVEHTRGYCQPKG